jgi:hypothetical protein
LALKGIAEIFGQKPNRPLRYTARITNLLIHATMRTCGRAPKTGHVRQGV